MKKFSKVPKPHVYLLTLLMMLSFTLNSSVFAEETLLPGFENTLKNLDLSADDKQTLMELPVWAKNLAIGMEQKEANALVKYAKKPGKIKFANMAPLGTTWAKYIREIPKTFKKRTKGLMTIDAYIGLSLGNDPDYVIKMASGSLESAGLTSWGMKYINKEMGVYELPFIFDNYGEADYVMAKTWPYFVEKFAKKGFTLVPVNLEVGFLQFFSTNLVAKKPTDLKGTKYGSWMGEVEISVFRQLGVNPVVVTVMELPSSLATGIIQTGAAPTMYMIGAQLMSFIEKGGGCSGMNMFYPPGGLVYIKKNVHNAVLSNVSKKERKYLTKYVDAAMNIFDEILTEAAPKLATELRAGNKKLLKNLQEKGMQLYIPTREEREEWKTATRPVWDKLAGKVYSQDLLNLVLKHKEDYRAAHPEEFETYVWAP